jgi:nitrogen fixation NifU-like protein
MTDDALYHEALLRLAGARTWTDRIEAPDASARRDNPLCGDDVAVDVRLDGGRIGSLAFRVRGCILCRAAASVLSSVAPGKNGPAIDAGRAAAAALLRGGASAPDGTWKDLSAFLPVCEVPSRHDCVLLPFEVLAEALARNKE